MTDIPPAPPTPPAGTSRAHTILGRLSQAVREQNGFAVVLERVIVVLGPAVGGSLSEATDGPTPSAPGWPIVNRIAK